MYVVIEGVHGIGKTTLCKELTKKKEFEYIPEIRDTILPPPVLGPKSQEKLKSQIWFLRQLILKNQKINSKSGIIISDRGPTSILVYSRVLLDDYDFELMKTLIENINLKEPELEIILWAPEEVIMKRIDGRSRESKNKWGEDDLHYLKLVNHEFKKYYEGFKDIKPIYLVDASGTVEKTCREIENIIKEKFKI